VADFIVTDQQKSFDGCRNLFGDGRLKMPGNRLTLTGLQGGMDWQVDSFSAAAGSIGK